MLLSADRDFVDEILYLKVGKKIPESSKMSLEDWMLERQHGRS